jgi:hypothetical protein
MPVDLTDGDTCSSRGRHAFSQLRPPISASGICGCDEKGWHVGRDMQRQRVETFALLRCLVIRLQDEIPKPVCRRRATDCQKGANAIIATPPNSFRGGNLSGGTLPACL